MSTKPSPVIVKPGECASCAVPTKQVHHRDFPEIWAEAGSAFEGLTHLAKRLSSARDGALSAWHRALIDHAIADIAELLENTEATDPDGESLCRCGPRGPDPSASPLPEPVPSRASRKGATSADARRRPSLRAKS